MSRSDRCFSPSPQGGVFVLCEPASNGGLCRFIEKNTLRIDLQTGLPTHGRAGGAGETLQAAASPVTPEPDSPLASLRTPEDHKKVGESGERPNSDVGNCKKKSHSILTR